MGIDTLIQELLTEQGKAVVDPRTNSLLVTDVPENFPRIEAVLATLDIGSVIILEATMSFLGLGVQPPAASWGSMIAEGRGQLSTAWWVCVMPGAVLIVTVLAVNLLGDALRGKLNPVIPQTW